MAQQNMVIDGANGRVAVYSGPQSDDIEADPMADISKVTYHSDLDNIGFHKVSASIPVALGSASAFQRFSISAYTHGLAYTPVFFAVLRNWPDGDGVGRSIPLGGGTLLDCFGQRPPTAGSYDINLGSLASLPDEKALIAGATADSTEVKFWVQLYKSGSASYSDTTFELDFYIGDRSIDGDLGDSAPDAIFDSGIDEIGNFTTVISSARIGVSGSSNTSFSVDKHYPTVTAMEDGDFPIFKGATSFLDYATGLPNSTYHQHRVVLDWGNGWAFRLGVTNYSINLGQPGGTIQPLPSLLPDSIDQGSI